MTLIRVDLKGLEELDAALGRVGETLDPDSVLDESGAILLNRVRTRFLDETDPDGKKWPPSQAARNRKASGRGGGTLFDTGNLWRSIQLVRVSKSERSIFTDVPYAKFHQFGIGQVQREFMGFSDDDVDVVSSLIFRRIEEALDE